MFWTLRVARSDAKKVGMREARAQKAGGKTQKDKDGLTPEQRRERDAKALEEKRARKLADAAGKK